MSAEQIIKSAIEQNPDIRIVLEIAARARESESKEIPVNIGIANDIAAIPANSQCLVPQATSGSIQTA